MDTLILIGQILIGLFILTFLVVIHELGHAIVARRTGVVVQEFGIGFPPRVFSKKLKNKVLLSINWLPLGGFVKLQGEHDEANKKGDYGAASAWQKTQILLAGVAVNWLFAAVAFTILALVGFPRILPNQFTVASDTTEVKSPLKIAFIEKGSPAEKIGLRVNDSLVSIGGKKVTSPDGLVQLTGENRGKTVKIVYRHGDQQRASNVALNKDMSKNRGVLGVSSSAQTMRYSTWSAPIVGVGTTMQFSVVTINGLGDLVVKLGHGLFAQLSGNSQVRQQGSQEVSAAGNSVGGPLSIIGVFFPAAQKAGLVMLLFLTALISLTLAVMNVLPVPALDGGRLFLMLIFRALKKPLTENLEQRIVGYSFTALMILVVIITVADVFKIQAL